MQSLRQYRKFRHNLETEIERYGLERVTSCARPRDSDTLQFRSQSEHKQHPYRTPTSTISDSGQEEAQLENEKPRGQQDVPGSLTNPSGGIGGQHDLANTTTMSDQGLKGTERDDTLSESTNVADDNTSDQGHEKEASTHRGGTLRHTGTRLGQIMTGISVRSHASRKNDQNNGHVFIVDYRGPDDPMNPHNWSTMRRLLCTVAITWISFIVGVASSIDSPAIPQASQEFGVSEVVESLATGLYLVGFGCGAFFAGPVSETIGRNPVYIVTGLLFMIFVMASGLSPNIGAQLAFRFLAGLFGSTPLTCAGGSLSDIWSPVERTAVFPLFAFSAWFGPAALGPCIGGFIAESSLISWRWCDWITLIWSGLIFGGVLLFMPETYAPILLKWKAEHLRNLTGNEKYMSEVELRETKFWDRMTHALYRPWIFLAFEPIIQLFTLYMTILYIIIFTFVTGFPYIFQDTYGLSQGVTFTIFLSLGVGFILSNIFIPYLTKRYKRKLDEARSQGHTRLAPEQRLLIAMIGGPFLPLGLFWMAWTCYPSVSIWSPILSCLPVGFGAMGVFIATYQYVIDSYETYAASALVGLTFVRYVAAGGMIPVSIPFYKHLGVHWTLTILGALSAIMAPVPYLFFYYGPKIRKMSKKAVQD